jgi:hypothetical protein
MLTTSTNTNNNNPVSNPNTAPSNIDDAISSLAKASSSTNLTINTNNTTNTTTSNSNSNQNSSSSNNQTAGDLPQTPRSLSKSHDDVDVKYFFQRPELQGQVSSNSNKWSGDDTLLLDNVCFLFKEDIFIVIQCHNRLKSVRTMAM